MQANIKTMNQLWVFAPVLALTCAAFEDPAAAKTISFLTAAGLTLHGVAALNRHVAVPDFQLPDNPSRGLLFEASKAAGVVEVKKFGVTFRGITEQSHCSTVRLPQHLARCRTHLAHQHEYSAAAFNSTEANTTPLPATLEHVFGIDAMGANQ